MSKKDFVLDDVFQENKENAIYPATEGDLVTKTRKGEIVDTARVHVREEPDPMSRSVALLQRGAIVSLLHEDGDYYRVTYQDNNLRQVMGYIPVRFVKEVS